MKTYSLIATAAAGIESLVNQELKQHGFQTQTENGRVRFSGTARDIAFTNLWLRTADRIKIVFGEFKAMSFEQLFDQTYALPWEDILPLDAEFPVSGKSQKSKLHSVPNCQRIVKKAIAKRLMDYYHRRTPLQETGANYPIEVAINKDIVLLTLDTSGSSLFKRGYRVDKGGAPLKENMAAALIQLTTWHPDRPLYDPTCGSGTILIEAALIGHNIAPGFNRSFAAEEWTMLNPEVWQEVRDEAESLANYDIELDLLGTDIDHRMIDIAKQNALEAGVADSITFKQMQLSDYVPDKEYGILISNPPYGDRLLDEEKVHELYRQMGEVYRNMPTWSKYILTSDEAFETYYGEKATKKRKLYNGALKVDYYQYWSKVKRSAK
ncbi:class I SAM-dependent RNA methyltransferase [Tuanshanicoccus lijuaniae]|uniref:THUMP domain-containing class I SAM-dependent RNA methyltransferase n=1 Tax=Aerococcaceae bacterium zg-1292 TaxID=2774330 RepID=UPI00193569AB|nr:class I SAM-dependent RNA methyltransferase [Aerococcaceae bacterium zg-1292]MBF6977660.1 class I SAM-dependent RNA methyltransferase [Aerococcaceae bacterium zg-BR22]MBS4456881.1 class I SAM-dependent RNA methyltransferase [Aerococcaceae bacterium zg-A91]MBS4458711.1 class I SAM-dependent RNA methyltransferase [Aerococcaceae bacterium zg-BR33]QQA36462.1 class I SAM-dependent RNA methyltransferase [Aerococcaceae bacterium zg-1292]